MHYPETNIFYFNDLKVVHIPLPNTGVVFSSVNVNVGALAEDVNFPSGTAHFLEHMLLKGTQSFPTEDTVYEKIEALGCYKNASTYYTHTEYVISVLKENFTDSLKYICEILSSPTLPQEKFENEKRVITEESKRAYTDQKRISFLNGFKTLFKLPRSEEMVLGTVESISKIKYEDVSKFYEEYYNMRNSYLFICGDIELDVLKKLMSENNFYFKNKSVSVFDRPRASVTGERAVFVGANRKNSSVSISYPVPILGEDGHEESAIIGSLFSTNKGPGHRRLRQELGLTYGISFFLREGSLSISFETDEKNENQAVDEVIELMRDMAENGVTELDFKKVISTRKFNDLTRLSNIVEFGTTHAYNFMMRPNLKSLQEYYELIYSPTRESVQKCIKEMIKSEPTIIITR